MDKLSTGKTMTTKEVAKALGVGVRTVQENGKALFPNRIANGKPTHWTEEEVGMIAEQIKSNHSATQATARVTREVTTVYTVPNLLAKAGQVATTLEQQMQIANAGMQALAKAMEMLKAENGVLKDENSDLHTENAGLQAENEVLSVSNTRLIEKNTSLQVELDTAKFFASVKRMEALNKSKKFSWRALKRYALENGIELKEVFDANYGTVKAYPKEVWEAVYGEQIDFAPWDKQEE